MDELQRTQALDTRYSYIVQAPAGSGKTTLLTQRFLSLLSVVNTPDEVVAVTFTKKAAGEMLDRIIASLEAAQGEMPQNAYEQQNYKLAQKVLKRSDELGWNILQNPHLLKLMTIDALAYKIASSSPLKSENGMCQIISSDPSYLYEEAVDYVFKLYFNQDPSVSDLKHLISHFDNQIDTLTSLFMTLLGSRDQWLPLLFRTGCLASQSLQNSFSDIKARLISSCYRRLKEVGDIDSLLTHAFDNLEMKVPFSDSNDPVLWNAVISVLLTSEDKPRKTVTVKQGFIGPSSCKSAESKAQAKFAKEAMTAYLQDFALQEDLLRDLISLRLLLAEPMNDAPFIRSLFSVLKILVAGLDIIFSKHRRCDYISISHGALRALEAEDGVTDLMLKLDQSISHLLVDEFQDTSYLQYKMLSLLVQEWDPSSKTVFLVGDPMQSIYQFRGSEVGLFLKVIESGFSNIPLSFLQLKQNFRSSQRVVDACNNLFSTIFPAQSSIALSAIPYTPAVSTAKSAYQNPVGFYLLESQRHEVQFICEQIKKIQAKCPMDSVAVLLQTRTYSEGLVKAFQKNSIVCVASEIEPISQNSAVLDLVCLWFSMQDPSDEISWLSLLRSPLLGFSIETIYAIKKACPSEQAFGPWFVRVVVNADIDVEPLAKDKIKLISYWLHNRFRMRYSEWLRCLWTHLGGDLYYEKDARAIEKVFDILFNKEYENVVKSKDLLFEKLNKIYIDIVPEDDNPVQVMTIHKAKGLEFDHVFVPFLDKKATRTSNDLIVWHTGVENEEPYELLAAKHARKANSPEYNYIKQQNSLKLSYEKVRLLYVAATRARYQIIFTAGQADNEVKSSNSASSYFDLISRTLAPEIVQVDVRSMNSSTDQSVLTNELPKNLMRYISEPLEQFIDQENQQWLEAFKLGDERLYSPETEAIVGIILHRLIQLLTQNKSLQTICEEQVRHVSLGYLKSTEQIEKLMPVIFQHLAIFYNCAYAKWIRKAHKAERCEWKLPYLHGGLYQEYIIDRTFIHNDRRWIIDYKTMLSPDAIEDYKLQLQRYKKVLSQFERRDTILALYVTDPAFEERFVSFNHKTGQFNALQLAHLT